jgi:hypothetical protein
VLQGILSGMAAMVFELRLAGMLRPA